MKLKLALLLLALGAASKTFGMQGEQKTTEHDAKAALADFRERKVQAAQDFDWSTVPEEEAGETPDASAGAATQTATHKKTQVKDDPTFDGTPFPADIQMLIKAYAELNNPIEFMPTIATKQTITFPIGIGPAVALTDRLIATTGYTDDHIRIFDINTHDTVKVIPNTAPIQSIALLTDGNIITTHEDNTTRIFDTETGTCLHMLTGNVVAIMPNGQIATASNNGTGVVRIYDATTGSLVRSTIIASTARHCFEPHALAALPNNTLVICSKAAPSWKQAPGYIHIWNPGTDALLHIHTLPMCRILSIQVTPDNLIAAIFRPDEISLRTFTDLTDIHINIYNLESNFIHSVSNYGIIGLENTNAITLPSKTNAQLNTVPILKMPTGNYSFDTSAKWLTLINVKKTKLVKDKEVYLWDCQEILQQLPSQNIQKVVVTPNNKTVVALAHNTITLYTLQETACAALQQFDKKASDKLKQFINKLQERTPKAGNAVDLNTDENTFFEALPTAIQECLKSNYPVKLLQDDTRMCTTNGCAIQ